MNDIVSEVIRSKCRKPCKCYLCDKRNTIPFILPEKEIIKMLYDISKSVEILKMIKVFWFCEEHFNLIKENRNNECENSRLDEIIETTYDIKFLDRVEQLMEDMIENDKIIRSYVRLLIKETADDSRL